MKIRRTLASWAAPLVLGAFAWALGATPAAAHHDPNPEVQNRVPTEAERAAMRSDNFREATSLDVPEPSKEEILAARVGGPVGSSHRDPTGALEGVIVYTTAGHGRTSNGSSWGWQRPILDAGNGGSILEDLGNPDQVLFFAEYLLNAGATVVPMRPIGFQDNEVIVDNPAAAYTGTWSDSTSTVYFGTPGQTPYRYASTTTGAATATARYNANISGFYPVYAWTRDGSDRANQQYIIGHSGGTTQRRVNHRRVGKGWVYLGTFHFAGSGYVEITNSIEAGDPGQVVIADAIRFGNGMGDINRGHGLSGYSRVDEAARYWIERGLGNGGASSIYNGSGNDNSDNIGAPPKMAAYMNRSEDGGFSTRVFVGWHTNAAGGRGAVGLYNSQGGNTPNQQQFAQLVGQEINTDLRTMTTAPGNLFEHEWSNRTTHTYTSGSFNYGEMSNANLGGEMDGVVVEGAFHDNLEDAKLLSDPKVRDAIARAVYQATVRFLNNRGTVSLAFLPEPPEEVRVLSDASGNLTLSWAPGPAGGVGGDAATGYVVYVSSNGYGFSEVGTTSGTSMDVSGSAPAGQTRYFRVSATNAGGESMPSAVVGARRGSAKARYLIVNGFDRFGRTQLPKQTVGSSGIFRHNWRLANSFDYAVQFGSAVAAYGRDFDTCQNESVANGQVVLGDYESVLWISGEESTADETFNAAERAALTTFHTNGGNIFASGAEIAWHLKDADAGFLSNVLRATYASDDANTYNVSAGVAMGVFDGLAALAFSDGATRYDVEFPDTLSPANGGVAALNYSTGATAGVSYEDAAGTNGKVVFWGFPFESIVNAAQANAAMEDIIVFFEDGEDPGPGVPDIELDPIEICIGDPVDPPLGEVTVEVASADIATNSIVVNLAPAASSGTLTVKLGSMTVYSGTHSGGSVSANFGDINALPDGQEFTEVSATWTLSGMDYSDTLPYHIKVLGVYRHTQYNIPAQSHATCMSGANTAVYITNSSCVFTPTTFRETFRAQTALNGRGTTTSYGIASVEFFCIGHANNPGASQGYAFRGNQAANGACGAVNAMTVAANQNHPDLSCGDQVYIHAPTPVVKTVTDYCPACSPASGSSYNHLDNFTTDGRCTGIVDFGNFKTIKIF